MLRPKALFKNLQNHQITVGCYESCTGGRIADWITNHRGASQWFQGGAVVYTEVAKIQLAGLSQAFLQKHSPVAAATSRALAEACQQQLQTMISIGITGHLNRTHGLANANHVFICLIYQKTYIEKRLILP